MLEDKVEHLRASLAELRALGNEKEGEIKTRENSIATEEEHILILEDGMRKAKAKIEQMKKEVAELHMTAGDIGEIIYAIKLLIGV